ncbi:MAG: hypothetical protein ACE366_21515 [Bradymonadia bacterium]
MSESPIAPAPPTDVTERDALTAPQVLAELELLRRKTALFERRLASWEDGLAEVRKRLHVLETERNPQTPEWQEELRDVQHRVGRLEARRLKAQALGGPSTTAEAPSRRFGDRPEIEDTIAITRARWSPENAKAGVEVTLSAITDGIEAGTEMLLKVHSLAAGEAIAEVKGSSNGDQLTATWKIPKSVKSTELFFTVEHKGARAKSSTLVVE